MGKASSQAAMGDANLNGEDSGCRRLWAISLGLATAEVAGGHGRCNLKLGQLKLQAAMGDGTCNGDSSSCRRPLAVELEMGQIKWQAAMRDATWNGDK